MTSGNRLLSFLVLAILLIIMLWHFPLTQLENVKVENAEKIQTPNKKVKSDPANKTLREPSVLFTLYDGGDIQVAQKKLLRNVLKVQKKKAEAPRKKTKLVHFKNLTKPKPVSQNIKGQWPILEVSYEDIGFDSYLKTIERLGHIFVLITTDEGRRLGREVSLSKRQFLPNIPDNSLLAVERPHLISDARISERLPNLPATSNIITSHVVLLLNKNIDKFLWSSIESHLYKRSLLLSKISNISGEYIIKNDQISLKLQSVSLKASGKK